MGAPAAIEPLGGPGREPGAPNGLTRHDSATGIRLPCARTTAWVRSRRVIERGHRRHNGRQDYRTALLFDSPQCSLSATVQISGRRLGRFAAEAAPSAVTTSHVYSRGRILPRTRNEAPSALADGA